MKTIFLIEDEIPIGKVLSAYLKREGYQVVWNQGIGDVFGEFIKAGPSLCLLDLTLPEHEGLELLEQFRDAGSCPVIILTARGALPDKIKGLKLGADDYIPKPFDPEEVMARIEAVLRRDLGMAVHNTARFGSLIIDFTAAMVSIGGHPLEMIPRDFQVLSFLAKSPNQCFSRELLLDRIWGLDYEGSDRAVDTVIKRLRNTLSQWPADEGEIQTVRGMGYRLYVR